MRPMPLKWRVSLLVAAVTVGVIVAVSATAYHEMRDGAVRQIDQTLLALGDGIAAALDDADSDVEVGAEIKAIAGASKHRHLSLYRIWVEGAPRDLFSGGVPEVGSSWEKVLRGPKPPPAGGHALFDIKAGSDTYRALWRRTQTNRGTVNIVIAQSRRYTDHEIDEYLRAIIWIGAVAVPVGIGLVLLLVWWGLRPIRHTARAMLGVTASNVGAVKLSAGRAPIELAPFVQAVADMLGRLDQTLQRQKRFVSDASHELRTPLALAKSTLQAARTRDRDAQAYRQAIDEVLEDMHRMGHLMEEMLVLARMDETEGVPEPARLRLDGLLGELAESYAPRLAQAGGKLEFEAQPVEVVGNAGQLTRLFANLLDNALKYGPAQGTVRLSVEPSPAGGVVVKVHDDGGGIPPEAIETVFERFVRLDESRSQRTGGVGLGLSIAREIARRHGGSIAIASDPASGTTVTVGLPAAGK